MSNGLIEGSPIAVTSLLITWKIPIRYNSTVERSTLSYIYPLHGYDHHNIAGTFQLGTEAHLINDTEGLNFGADITR